MIRLDRAGPDWRLLAAVKTEQKPTDVRGAKPSLLGSSGIITGILYPLDGMSLEDRLVIKRGCTGPCRETEFPQKIGISKPSVWKRGAEVGSLTGS
jgi:hypothetical protein